METIDNPDIKQYLIVQKRKKEKGNVLVQYGFVVVFTALIIFILIVFIYSRGSIRVYLTKMHFMCF